MHNPVLNPLPSPSLNPVFKPCVSIPVYNHEHAIGKVLAAVLACNIPCILVDDGSSADCAGVLRILQASTPERVTLVVHEVNQGKGAAVITGFHAAAAAGYTHVLQIDADGQHCVADIPRFLAQATMQPDAVIVGYPVYDESVPTLRLYARYLTHVWVWINTLSLQIRDSMCGFRVYPLQRVLPLLKHQKMGQRMNFDTDILVRLYWDGVEMMNTPTRVGYPEDGVSHFDVWRDNVLITIMHTTLFFGMLPRIPMLLWRNLKRALISKPVKEMA